MIKRHTIQKELIYNAVISLHGHVTAEEVYDFIKKDHSLIGKGTVYRNLSILADEGAIRRVEIPNGPDRFDFTLKKHYHVLCVKCDKVMDVEMDPILNIEDRIKSNNGIKFLDYDILFKGICPDCQDNK